MADRHFIVGLWSRQTNQAAGLKHGWAQTMRALTEAVERTARELSRLESLPTGSIKGIFLAPEFLFSAARYGTDDPTRRRNTTHALGTYALHEIRKGLVQLSQDHPDFLMVPGSVVFSQSVENRQKREAAIRDIQAAKTGTLRHQPYRIMGKESQNLANRYDGDVTKLQSAFENQQEREQELNEAFRAAQVQFHPAYLKHNAILRNQTWMFLGGIRVATYGKKAYAEDFCEDLDKGIYVPGNETGTYEIDGISFGIEICYDHAVGTLKSCRKNADLDFHIILSAEVPNDQSNCMARQGGYILHASSSHNYSGVFLKMRTQTLAQKAARDKESYKEMRGNKEETRLGYKKVDAVSTADVGAILCVYLIKLERE